MLRQFVLFACCLSACATTTTLAQIQPRPEGVRLASMGYHNSSGENGATTFFYDRLGRLSGEFWTLDGGSRWSDNLFLHDMQGRPIEKHRAFSDSLTSVETYLYDAAGRLSAETFERSDGRTGRADYEWSDDGRLLVARCDNWKGWLTARIEYRYLDGRLAGAALTRDGEEIGRIDYDYAAGRRASETWDFGGRWSQTFIYEYEPAPACVYDASSPLMNRNPRFRVVAESYDFDGRSGGPSHYRYDRDGRLAEKIFERSDGLRTRTTYVYGERGDLISSHREYHDGATADFDYRYDAAGHLTGKTFRRSDGAEGSEAYGYDRFGRLATAEYRNMDFWLNGTITFEYDGRGRLCHGRFEATDVNSADLVIDCDVDRNVTRVRWDLDRGFTQTYEFGYEPATGRPR